MSSLNQIIMHRSSRRMIKSLETELMDVAEISGKKGKGFKFKSYSQFRHPEYDICAGPFMTDEGKPRKFDLIMANQVWEHLDRPYAATKNIRKMLKKGAYFWLAVPFYIPFHAGPMDNSRWSARGLKNLLIECGFEEDAIVAKQWGNRNAALRNMEEVWPPEYDEANDPLDNDPDMPVCAWALAQKT